MPRLCRSAMSVCQSAFARRSARTAATLVAFSASISSRSSSRCVSSHIIICFVCDNRRTILRRGVIYPSFLLFTCNTNAGRGPGGGDDPHNPDLFPTSYYIHTHCAVPSCSLRSHTTVQFTITSPNGDESWKMMDEMISHSENFCQAVSPHRYTDTSTQALMSGSWVSRTA